MHGNQHIRFSKQNKQNQQIFHFPIALADKKEQTHWVSISFNLSLSLMVSLSITIYIHSLPLFLYSILSSTNVQLILLSLITKTTSASLFGGLSSIFEPQAESNSTIVSSSASHCSPRCQAMLRCRLSARDGSISSSTSVASRWSS